MEFNAKTVSHDQRRQMARSKTRIYIWPANESVMDNFVNRRNRPYDEWRTYAQKAAILFDVKADQISWSRTAGCSCGCSPGFVVKGNHRPGFDIHVTLGA